MSKALIITAHVDGIKKIAINKADYDLIICADGGHIICTSMGLTPDVLIGDFDSSKQLDNIKTIKLPAEKDMTDSEAAIDYVSSIGFRNITMLGGLGGRFDHTMGNLGMLSKYLNKLEHFQILDGQNCVFMKTPGTYIVKKKDYKYIGLIAYGGDVINLTIEGVKYPLLNHHLTCSTSLGVSNEILENHGSISFTQGKLLVILSKDIDNSLE